MSIKCFHFKYIIVGDANCGKSSFLRKYTTDNFSDSYCATIGVDNETKYITINNHKIKLGIWDAAGQEKFRILTNIFYRGSIGAIVMFDITNLLSFQNAEYWINDIKRLADYNTEIILVGNKCDLDLDREVIDSDICKLVEKYKIKYFEASAKSGININTTFDFLTNKIILKIKNNILDENRFFFDENIYNGLSSNKINGLSSNKINGNNNKNKKCGCGF